MIRLGVRGKTVCLAFLLAEPLSSIDSADASAASLFADVAGTTDSSDFLLAFMSVVPPEAFSDRSTPRVTYHDAQWKPNRISRGSATGVSTHVQGLRLRRVGRRLAMNVAVRVAFPLSGQGRHAGVMRCGAEYLACVYPLPMPHPRCYHRQRRVWGRAVGWTLLVRLSHSLLQSGLARRFPRPLYSTRPLYSSRSHSCHKPMLSGVTIRSCRLWPNDSMTLPRSFA